MIDKIILEKKERVMLKLIALHHKHRSLRANIIMCMDRTTDSNISVAKKLLTSRYWVSKTKRKFLKKRMKMFNSIRKIGSGRPKKK